jgi:hypothetical protein
MKTSWKFYAFLLALSFILGFSKPLISSNAHSIITLVSYAAVWGWFLVFKKSTQKNTSRTEFWERILILTFVLITISIIGSLFPTQQKLVAILKLIVLAVGGTFCLSENFRIYVQMIISSFKDKR